jgi:hypothetical protein
MKRPAGSREFARVGQPLSLRIRCVRRGTAVWRLAPPLALAASSMIARRNGEGGKGSRSTRVTTCASVAAA